MTRVTWSDPGQRFYETGVDRGVLYTKNNPGVPWNGLVSVSESPSGGAPKPYYMDGHKYLNLSAFEEYEATLDAYYSPREFDICDGSLEIVEGFYATHQTRQTFGLTYRTMIGNDLDGSDHGYKIHLVYNAMATPADRSYETLNDSPDAAPLSWEITTQPVIFAGMAPTAHYVLDSTKSASWLVKRVEDILYGTDDQMPRLPLPDEIESIYLDGPPKPPYALPRTVDDGLTYAINNAMRLNLIWWLNTYYPGTGPVVPADGNEYTVRQPLALAFGTAAAISTGRYRPGTGQGKVDLSEAAATARVQRILDGVSSVHLTQPGGVWGGHWQSAQWTTMLVTTAKLSPPTQTVRDRIATVTAFEADRLLSEPVLFWKQWDGTENFPGDTKAEENAWNGAFLIVAAVMYPEATNAAEWYQKGLEFSAAAVAMPHDQATGVVHGNAMGDFPGYNINDDGSLENHGYLNPHYTASITELLWGVVSILGHLWYLIPDAVVHNAQLIYRYFDGPLYNGRTIYTPRTGDIYYPEGWANGTWRIDNFLTADVVAHVYELDREANHPAAYWAELHMADLLAHQARYTSGQTYIPQDDENNYPGREQEVLRHLGFQALAAAASKGAAAFDGRSIPFSGAATALPVQNSGVGLHHRWEVDSLGSAPGAITATSWVDTGSRTRPLEKVGAPVLEQRASRLGVAFPASSGSWFTSTRVTPEGATYLVAVDGVTATGRQMFSAGGFAVRVEDTYWGLRFNGTQIARTYNIAKTANVPVIIGFTTTPDGRGNLFGQDPNGQQGPWPYTGNVPTGAGVQIGENVSVPMFGARMWGEPLSDQDVLDAMATMWADIFGNA